MDIIDQAILIPASPDFIWRFVGDLSKNVDWQEDLTHISFLTTQREGKGARWRYSTAKGHDVIAEIVAWYDTLGYEYKVVDGAKFGSNQGYIRLQEIAEGTRVRWTFHYEPRGVFGGLRNSMGRKRSIASGIEESLRNLHKLIQEETGGISTHQAKATLKEAPDVEERSSYRPRHPSAFVDSALKDIYNRSEASAKQPISYQLDHETAPAPPLADEDTKPNPVVQAAMPPQNEAESTAAPSAKSFAPEPAVKKPARAEKPAPVSDVRSADGLSVFDVFGLQKPSEAVKWPASPPAEERDLFPETSPPTEEAEAETAEIIVKSEAEPAAAAIDAKVEIRVSGWRRISRHREMKLRQRR